MRIILLMTMAILLIFSVTGYSQGDINNFNYQITYTTTGEVDALGDSIFVRECNLVVSDTVNLALIHIEIGTEEDLSNFLNYSFAFDETNGLPSGLAYERDEFVIKLLLHEVESSDMYYYKIALEDTQGSVTQALKWY